MIKLDKKSFYSLVATSMSVVGPFILVVVSAALLTPDAFATNASNIYIVMLFATVVSLQIQNSALRIDPLVNMQDDFVRMVTLTKPQLVPGIVFCYVLFYVMTSIQKIEFNFWAFFLLIVVSIGYQAYQGLLNILIRREALKKQSYVQVIFFGVQILFVSIYANFAPDSEWVRITSMLVAITLVPVFFWRKLRGIGEKVAEPYYFDEHLRKYTIWLIPLALSNFVLGYFDKIYASNNLVGEYAKEYLILSHIFSAFVILPMAINRLIIPKIFDGRISIDFMKTFEGFKFIVGLLLVYVFLSCGIYVALKFIFESKLDSIGLIITILVATQIARAIYLILVTDLHRQYRSRTVTIIALASALSYVALTIVFVERGLVAVCLCALFAQSLQMIGVIFYVAPSEKKTR